MAEQVSLESMLDAEGGGTVPAAERLLATVQTDVGLKVAAPVEGGGALVATVRFLAGMYPCVVHQIAFPLKRGGTGGTEEGFLVVVRLGVSLQKGLVPKGCVAQVTTVGFSRIRCFRVFQVGTAGVLVTRRLCVGTVWFLIMI